MPMWEKVIIKDIFVGNDGCGDRKGWKRKNTGAFCKLLKYQIHKKRWWEATNAAWDIDYILNHKINTKTIQQIIGLIKENIRVIKRKLIIQIIQQWEW